jgi:curved DNA-binding protein CbpA
MTIREAYRILGLSPESEFEEIKKKYRKLMQRVHPDVLDASVDKLPYHAHEINTAYALLKKRHGKSDKIAQAATKKRNEEKNSKSIWNAPVNSHAYADRDILQNVEDYDGTVLGNFCVATGKYLWTPEEDFPLFLLSMYRCSKRLLDDIDATLGRDENLNARGKLQPELTYLLAQQFMDATALLTSLAKEKSPASDGKRIFYIPAMLETSYPYVNLSEGEPLMPSRLKNHRLYLKNHSGNELGYLSFVDDRLYYVVIPLFEQKMVQIRVKYTGYKRKLHLWVKLSNESVSSMPESVNLQI